MKFIYIVLLVVFILFARAVFIEVKTGVFGSVYGEAITVRKSEGALG